MLPRRLLASLLAGPSWSLAAARMARAHQGLRGVATEEPRPPLPPFTQETAAQKVQLAEDAWNSKDPAKVAMAYTPDSKWRNRSEIFQGREAIREFLTRKWQKERDYRLKKYLWSFSGSRIAVRFEYEWRDDKDNWTRSYGIELWEFAPDGRMAERHASINDVPISQSERRLAKPGNP